MDRHIVRDANRRWQVVPEVELQEQQSAPLARKWRQMNAILCIARGLGLDLRQDDGDEVVRRRWAKLKSVQQ